MVKVNQETCIGCGLCPSVCPEVFEMDEKTNKAKVKPKANLKSKCIQEAIDSCPVNAISM